MFGAADTCGSLAVIDRKAADMYLIYLACWVRTVALAVGIYMLLACMAGTWNGVYVVVSGSPRVD